MSPSTPAPPPTLDAGKDEASSEGTLAARQSRKEEEGAGTEGEKNLI